MIEAGKLLQNRYRVQKQIGQGGMGAVYVATDERFGSTVAIKETLVMESNYLKAIEREARLLNSLRHPALPRVSDHFTEENGQFLVMEYIAGDDLSEMMERTGKAFPVEDVLNWADQLLDALEFLHTQEIPVIHRDIKPQNLKLTPRGQIILLDFGLAKGNPTDAAHQTASKSIFGYSRSYASLEQIQGTGTDPRSDLYSLAATLYHLLVGVPPEDALTRAMHVLSEKDDTLKPVNALNPQVPQGVAAVLHNAMALNANHRPASAKMMRQMLRDNEKYANLIVDAGARKIKTAGGLPLATDASMRATKLMPIVGNNQTDVKTELFPENPSQETSVRKFSSDTKAEAGSTQIFSAANTESNDGKRKSIFAATSIGALLLTGIAAFALYSHKPEIFGAKSVENKAAEVKSVAANNNGFENDLANENWASAAVNVEVKNAGADVAEAPKQQTKTVSTSSGGKNSGTTKNTAKNNKTSAGAKEKDNSEGITIEDETVYMGDVKITGERIETPTVIIDEKGMRPKNPLKPLTPEELEKVRNAMKFRVLRNAAKNKHKSPPPPVPTPPKDRQKP